MKMVWAELTTPSSASAMSASCEPPSSAATRWLCLCSKLLHTALDWLLPGLPLPLPCEQPLENDLLSCKQHCAM